MDRSGLARGWWRKDRRRRKGKKREEGKEEGEGRRHPSTGVRMSFSPQPARILHGSLLRPCQRISRIGYFGWQHDWELEKQEIEW